MAELGVFPIRYIISDTFGPLCCPQLCITSGFFFFQVPRCISEIVRSSTSTFFSLQYTGIINCYPFAVQCETTRFSYNTRSTIAIPSLSNCSRIGLQISSV
jgi:hypothetical protein